MNSPDDKKAAPDSPGPLDQFKDWGAAIWGLFGWLLVAVVGQFLAPPPDETEWARIAQFLGVTLLGFPLILLMRRRNPKSAACWWGVAALLAVFGFAAFFGYEYLRKELTGRGIDGQPFVIGGVYTQEARSYLERNHRPLDCDPSVIHDFEGNPDKVWTRDSRIWRAHQLGVLYTGLAVLFMGSFVIAAQAMRSVYARRKPPKTKGDAT